MNQLHPTQLQRLIDLVSSPTVRLVLLVDDGARREFGALVVQSTEQIVADPEMSMDSFRWIRTGRRDVLVHGDGVTIDTSGKQLTSESLGDRFCRPECFSVPNGIRTTRIGAGRSAAVRSVSSRAFVQADPSASLAHLSIIAPQMGNDRVLAILRQAKTLARDYYRLTGKPLGVTGEVAEYEAAHILRIELTPASRPATTPSSAVTAVFGGSKSKDAVCYLIANLVSASAGLIPRRIGTPS
jgi:hypothetical protein